MKITKYLDRATPDLIVGAAFGDRYPSAELVLVRSGEAAKDDATGENTFFRIKMTDVTIGKYSSAGDAKATYRQR